MNTNMSMICDNFIGGGHSSDTWTGSFETEYKYIEWLFCRECGSKEDYTEKEIDAVWEKFQAAEGLDEFSQKVVTRWTNVTVNGKTFRAERLATQYGDYLDYEGSKYVLLRAAEPGEQYDAAGKPIPCYDAGAIRLGDEIDYQGLCKRYLVVWEVYEDFTPEDDDMSEACDWETPVEIQENNNYYNVTTGEYC